MINETYCPGLYLHKLEWPGCCNSSYNHATKQRADSWGHEPGQEATGRMFWETYSVWSATTERYHANEDFSAGRWWWEEAGKKECGLHVHTEAVPDKEDIMSEDISPEDVAIAEGKV